MIGIIYLFDFCGELIDSGNVKELSIKYEIPLQTIYASIARDSIVNQKYYFRKTKEYFKASKKCEFNPLTSKTFSRGI